MINQGNSAPKCPHCQNFLYLKVRMKTGSDDILQWVETCQGCHYENVVKTEKVPE